MIRIVTVPFPSQQAQKQSETLELTTFLREPHCDKKTPVERGIGKLRMDSWQEFNEVSVLINDTIQITKTVN